MASQTRKFLMMEEEELNDFQNDGQAVDFFRKLQFRSLIVASKDNNSSWSAASCSSQHFCLIIERLKVNGMSSVKSTSNLNNLEESKD